MKNLFDLKGQVRHAMLPLLLLPMMVATKAMAQGVTDVHSHIITAEFLSALEGEGRLLDEGFPLPKYDAAAPLQLELAPLHLARRSLTY